MRMLQEHSDCASTLIGIMNGAIRMGSVLNFFCAPWLLQYSTKVTPLGVRIDPSAAM